MADTIKIVPILHHCKLSGINIELSYKQLRGCLVKKNNKNFKCTMNLMMRIMKGMEVKNLSWSKISPTERRRRMNISSLRTNIIP